MLTVLDLSTTAFLLIALALIYQFYKSSTVAILFTAVIFYAFHLEVVMSSAFLEHVQNLWHYFSGETKEGIENGRCIME
jgi:hypothetical protein